MGDRLGTEDSCDEGNPGQWDHRTALSELAAPSQGFCSFIMHPGTTEPDRRIGPDERRRVRPSCLRAAIRDGSRTTCEIGDQPTSAPVAGSSICERMKISLLRIRHLLSPWYLATPN